MAFLRNYIVYLLLFMLLAACGSPQRVQSNLPSPGKQCKVLITKKHKKTHSRRNIKANTTEHSRAPNSNLQANLLTDEEYLEQVAKVKKSLPKFDVDRDCPQEVKRSRGKKKGFWSLLFK